MTTSATPPWVGLIGAAGSGKDEVAQVLVRSFGYTRVAFADPVRQALLAVDPLIPTHNHLERPEWISPIPGTTRLSTLLETMSYEEAKRKFPEVRALLQRMGTEAIRALDEDFWLKLAREAGEAAPVAPVFTDTRFINEVLMVKSRGIIIKVDRPGHTNTAAGHVSEEQWLGIKPDRTIINNATLQGLRFNTHFLMATILEGDTDA